VGTAMLMSNIKVEKSLPLARA